MTDVAALISDMVQAGVPAELVGRVAKALSEREVVVIRDESAERRRAADRDRKRSVRGIPQTSADSADIAETAETPLPPCPPAFPPDPHTTPLNPPIPESHGGAGEVAKARSTGPPGTGTRLPRDWTPSADDRQYAHNEGLTDDQTDRVADDFRDYWVAKPGAGGRKVDWPATWRRWIRTNAERAGNPSGGYRGGGAAGRSAGGGREPASLLAALAETARDMGRQR